MKTASITLASIVALAFITLIGTGLILPDSGAAQMTSPTTTPAETQTPRDALDPNAPAIGVFEATPAPVVLEVDSDGNILLRGMVTEMNPDFLTVESWGGIWIIRMTVDGTVVPNGPDGSNDLSAIRVGDFVGAEGIVASNESYTIYASFVRDWTTNPIPGMFETAMTPSEATSTPMPATSTQSTSTDNETLPDDNTNVSTGTPKIGMEITSWNGTIEEVMEDSFSFTGENEIPYLVETGNAIITNEDGNIISMDDIETGDDVVVQGLFDGMTITASSVEVDTSWWPF